MTENLSGGKIDSAFGNIRVGVGCGCLREN